MSLSMSNPVFRLTSVAALVAVLSQAAAAQGVTPGAPTTPEPAGHFVIDVGLDPLLNEAPQSSPGRVLHAGYERRIATSRWGLRLAGDFVRGTTRFMSTEVPDAPSGPVNRITTISGGGLLATYQLSAGRSRSYLRPYALAGVGIQQLSLRHEGDAVWLGPNMARQVIYAPPQRRNSAAFTAGLGLAARLGPAALFAEGRLTYLPSGTGNGTRAPIQGVLAPLTIGVRF